MGMWPFRRRSNRRNTVGGAELTHPEMHNAGTRRDPARHNGSELAAAGPERRRSRRDTKRKASRESKKLQRNPEHRRTYSFSPGRNDSIRVPEINRPPVPPLPPNVKGKGRVNSEKRETEQPTPPAQRAYTQPTANTYEWQRMPTLHKRSAQELARRKSSKKRKEDHDREAEIRAMVAFMPTRPAADATSSGRPMKRDTKKMRSGLNRNLENPSSDISLPLVDSIHSSLSSGLERQTSYKLSALDVLTPRPTIRYGESPKYVPGASIGSNESRERRIYDRMAIPEEMLKANKRINELADDLNAHELRELMERDQKRREKKKIAEAIKMERRLARRQEKQREGEAAAARDGTPSPPNMERGVFGRDVVGLGIGTSTVVTSSKRKGSVGSENGRSKRPTDNFRQESSASGPSPEFYRTSSLDSKNVASGAQQPETLIDTAKVGTVGKASASPPASPKGHARGDSSISQMELNKPEPAVPISPEPPRHSTESSTRAGNSWISFFRRRGAKTKRASTPSSFSNTSRDSMSMQAGYIPQVGYTPMRSAPNVPKRTMSKFREDLPELPISPPDSRVQSPEADMVPVPIVHQEKKTLPIPPPDEPRVRYDTPTSGYRSIDAMRLRNETPTSGYRSMDTESPDPETALSQSLASIDSEGSWLSGRRAGSKRSSAPQVPHHPLRDSASSLDKRYKAYSGSQEELGIAEDEYFSRLTPGPEDQYKIRRESTGKPMPSSDEEDNESIDGPDPSEKTKWGAVGRHPTVIYRQPRAKSREGLLNEFDDESFSEFASVENAMDPKRRSFPLNREIIEEGEPGVHKATSIDKRHARHISAGSARLLDLGTRPSGESRRLSYG